MSDIEKIRQEIERRKKRWMYDDLPIAMGRYYEDRDLLAFIDSLPEEIPPYCTGFKGNPDPPGISDLEQAAKEYSERVSGRHYRDLTCGFIAGAEWQTNQLLKGSPLPEDTVLFQKGVEEGRRLERDDLALTWEDMVLLRTLFDATDAKQSRGALTVQPMTREYYEYLLREFNEQRKK